MEDKPKVSIITATYNRSHFYENLKRMVANQDYPHDRIEWIIMDDSPVSHSSYFPDVVAGIKVQYYHLLKKIPLARKRDLLNHKATGQYIVNFDDDDYYPASRVSHAVDMMVRNAGNLAGGGIMYMYFTSNKKIYRLGPYCANHATAATMAYSKEYSRKHSFGSGHYAEESTFTDGWKQPMIDLAPEKTVLALSHSENTIDKNIFLDGRYGQLHVTVHETDKRLEDFIQEADILDFYRSLGYDGSKSTISTIEVKDILEKSANDIEQKYNVATVNRIINDLSREQSRVNIRRVLVDHLEPYPTPKFT
jgi:glycosyltransferase involved in cell wall biosynthesis